MIKMILWALYLITHSLMQMEPVYVPAAVIDTMPPEYNVEKFSNPPVTVTRLTKSKGVNMGPSGKETWYNLPMSGVIKIMRGRGYSEEEYPFWERDDGVKMFGPYIMIAADTNVRPKGTLLETSLGTGMVCDHCVRAETEKNLIDIAANW